MSAINIMINLVIDELLKKYRKYKHWILKDYYYYDCDTFYLIIENSRNKSRKNIKYSIGFKKIEICNSLRFDEYCFLDCYNLEYLN